MEKNSKYKFVALMATVVCLFASAASAADNSALNAKAPKHKKLPELSKETAPDIHQSNPPEVKSKLKHKKKEKTFDLEQKPAELNPALNK